jgi:hypothetical protein
MSDAFGTALLIALIIASIYAGEKIAIHRRRVQEANQRAMLKSALREQQAKDDKLNVLVGSTCSCDQCNAEWPARRRG